MRTISSRPLVLLLLWVFAFINPIFAAPGDENWDGNFAPPPGLNGDVYCSLSVGNDLYVGGAFTKAGGTDVDSLARWDGSRWHRVGIGLKGTVYALAARGRELFVGGEFVIEGVLGATNIAKWNGQNWSSLGGGMPQMSPAPLRQPHRVHALALDSRNLYVGGSFQEVGGISATNIARWDGRSWWPLSSGVGDGLGISSEPWKVLALLLRGSDLYVGGEFPNAGDIRCNNLARWDGRRWHDVGGGVSGGPPFRSVGVDQLSSGWVQALAFHQGHLYAGGSFTNAGNTAARSIARWDGRKWAGVLGGVSLDGDKGVVSSILANIRGIVVGGLFDHAGEAQAANIAQFDGRRWHPLGSGIVGAVASLTISRTTLFAGGRFALAGNSQAGFLAEWNGVDWYTVGTSPRGTSILGGLNTRSNVKGNALIGTVYSIAVGSNQVYLGGYFDSAGSMRERSGLVALDQTRFSPIPTANPFSVLHLAVAGSNVYVGGSFRMPEIQATNIAGWNGTEWFALPGLAHQFGSGDPWTLATDGTILYASGYFTSASGQEAEGHALWDGENWKPFGQGILRFGSQATMVTDGQKLYFGANGNIALWDGAAWSTPAQGPFPTNSTFIHSVAVLNGILYAAGIVNFQDDYSGFVVSWDGTAWSTLALHDGIGRLAVCGDRVFVGGQFSSINGVPANNIAAWDGSQWSALGSGLNGQVHAIASDGQNVYCGGEFTTAGKKSSYHFAVWHEN